MSARAPRSRVDRACAAAVCTLCAIAFGLLAWKAALPNNQHRDTDQVGAPLRGEMWGQNAHGYDDAVTVVTARNFARDGFLRTHLLANRKGAPLASFFDFGQTQCLSRDRPDAPPLEYRSMYGEWIPMYSLTGDCIYTHYPPLADWVFGAMAALGLDSILAYRLLAIALSCLTLGLLYVWLRREVHPVAALGATALVALSPAFFHWAAVLFHASFEYLFLVAGLLSWSLFLERRRRRWFALTWLLFFLQALVSYELIAFFAVAVLGLAALDGGGAPLRQRAGWVIAQGTAVVAAVALHFALRVSFFGLDATWQNVVATASARAAEGWNEWREKLLFNRLAVRLLRPELAALAVAIVLAVRSAASARPRRAAALLGIMIAGGVSFFAFFPGMAWVHGWVMYRHLLPATALLLAYAIDAAVRATSLRPPPTTGPGRRIVTRALALAAALLALVPPAWSLRQSVAALRREVAWVRAANRHHDPANHAVRFLDLIHWVEAGPPTHTLQVLLTADGRRVDEHRHPLLTFALLPEAVQHYELWWLDEISLSSVRFLTEAPWTEMLQGQCRMSLFDGAAFQPIDGAGASVRPFVAAPAEPVAPSYVWWDVPARGRTRAIRLTCRNLPQAVPLHEVEVY